MPPLPPIDWAMIAAELLPMVLTSLPVVTLTVAALAVPLLSAPSLMVCPPTTLAAPPPPPMLWARRAEELLPAVRTIERLVTLTLLPERLPLPLPCSRALPPTLDTMPPPPPID